MSTDFYVPMEMFYDYVMSDTFPKYMLRSVVLGFGTKQNYKKFAKKLKKALKYLPPEIEVEIRVERKDTNECADETDTESENT